MENLFETRPDFTCNHDMRRCKVNGKDMFCTEERIADKDMPKDLYKAEVRGIWGKNEWGSIEPIVSVDFIATLVSDKPFNYDNTLIDGYPYIKIESYEIEKDPDLD